MKKSDNIKILTAIILFLIYCIIDETSLSIIVKAILSLIIGGSIAFILCKLSISKINSLEKISDIIINIFKKACIIFTLIIIICNVITMKYVNEQYNTISKNIEFLENNTILKYSDTITKIIVINIAKTYDGILYTKSSILNEKDNIKLIEDKYIKSNIENDIISLVNNTSFNSLESITNEIKYIFSLRKAFKNTIKLCKLQYISIISFSCVLYIIISKFIFFNKKRKQY